MSSAIGTLTSTATAAAQGPLFIDKLTMVGDAGYPTGGTLNFLAAFRKLRKDNATILDVKGYADAVGYSVRYTPPVFNVDGTVATADKLQVFLESQSTGITAEIANATDLSARTFTLTVESD